ncbi:MAG: hypothetical protein M5R40_28875 [Anaerolineae bacterium]|nr:hypothetical protein [Anaerolineae bacterium]
MSNSRAIRRPAWGRTCGRLGGLLLVLLIAIVPASTALAQESGLVAGQAATGTITDANYMNVWRYESPGNETINVAVEATSGNLDTTLVVISSSLDVLAVNDDIDPSNGNFNSAISGLIIPNADTIFVIVSRYDTQAGSTTGAYRVLLTTGSGGGMITTGGTTGGSTTGGQTGTLTLDQALIDGKLQDAFDHLIALGVIPDWDGTIGINIPDNAFLESFRADEHQLFMRVGQGYGRRTSSSAPISSGTATTTWWRAAWLSARRGTATPTPCMWVAKGGPSWAAGRTAATTGCRLASGMSPG